MQPAPNVSQADVDCVVRREFASDDVPVALAALEQYGRKNGEREAPRVRLAALKLANADLDELRRQVEWAKCDFRDVVGPAEYPMAMKRLSLLDLAHSERQAIYDADWRQYDEWLRRK